MIYFTVECWICICHVIACEADMSMHLNWQKQQQHVKNRKVKQFIPTHLVGKYAPSQSAILFQLKVLYCSFAKNSLIKIKYVVFCIKAWTDCGESSMVFGAWETFAAAFYRKGGQSREYEGFSWDKAAAELWTAGFLPAMLYPSVRNMIC